MKTNSSPVPTTVIPATQRNREITFRGSSGLARPTANWRSGGVQVFAMSLALLLAGLAPGAFAQDLPYESGSTGADGAFNPMIGPGFGIRSSHSGAFDEARGEAVLFGGLFYFSFPSSTSLSYRNDTFAWNGATWSQKASSGGSTFIHEGAMAYDAASQKAVYYGGRNSVGTYFQETWLWDGTNWTRPLAASPPGTRGHHAMAYDATAQQIILFGGYNGSTAAPNTTWAWNSASNTWSNQAPANSPSARYHHAMCWDAARQEIVMFGGHNGTTPLTETWIWKNGNWTEKSPVTSPPARFSHAIGYDPGSQKVVCFGGWTGGEDQIHGDTWLWDGTNWTPAVTASKALTARVDAVMATDTVRNQLLLMGGRDFELGMRDDTWRWDGTSNTWVQLAGSVFMVDMNVKPNGVWNHTSITVPDGVTVEFVPNANNSPVTWLATDDVVIQGAVNANGRTGFLRDNFPGRQAPGGPGGFAGGLGGTRPEVFNTVAGTPGQGPGGGGAGLAVNANGGDGLHQGVYGNVYVIPLLGGSGGGGGAADSSSRDGGNGGGGGGVILIASARDITVNGAIRANGGRAGQNVSHTALGIGGHGSGGAVKLVADRILGGGVIETRNGVGIITSSRGGYVRLESYLRPFDIGGTVATGNRSNAAPVPGVDYGTPAMLSITQVDGEIVAQPPTGSFNSPDVIFSDAGTISVTVTATGIPDATPVTVRITHTGGVTNLPAVNLSGGAANFNAAVPAGFGTIQAFANFNVTP